MVSVQPVLGAALVATAVPTAWWAVTAGRSRGIDPAESLRRGVARGANLRALDLERGAGERVGAPLVAGLARVARRVTPSDVAERVEQRLVAANVAWTAERFYAAKVTLLTLGAVLGLIRLAAAPGPVALVLAVALVAAGWFGPDLVLRSRADRKAATIRQELPDTIDQVTIAVEAGLAFEGALARAAATGHGPLAEELSRTLQDVQLGLPRADALAGLAARTGLPEMNRLVSAIGQSERYGVPIVKVLRVQAADLRERRRQRAEELAMKIPVKIVLPLVFCILPTLFIVVLGPAVVQFVQDGIFR